MSITICTETHRGRLFLRKQRGRNVDQYHDLFSIGLIHQPNVWTTRRFKQQPTPRLHTVCMDSLQMAVWFTVREFWLIQTSPLVIFSIARNLWLHTWPIYKISSKTTNTCGVRMHLCWVFTAMSLHANQCMHWVTTFLRLSTHSWTSTRRGVGWHRTWPWSCCYWSCL